MAGLQQRGILTNPSRQLVAPKEAPEAALLEVHAPAYLEKLSRSSRKVAEVRGPFMLLGGRVWRPPLLSMAGGVCVGLRRRGAPAGARGP